MAKKVKQLPNYISNPGKVKIIKVFNYEGADILIQVVGYLFQFIIYKGGSFYQHFVWDGDKEKIGATKYTAFEMVRMIGALSDMATSVVDGINGKYEEVTPEKEQAAVIIDALEKAKEADTKVN